MPKRLFLLDGLALAYRAHFAFVSRPIRTSKGFNTSALFGFTSTLLDIFERGRPTHLAVAFDTDAPTPRHREFPEYKAHREAMPEDLVSALPHLRRIIAAFNLQSLVLDGYEADDLIGTLARRAETGDFETFMVTPDKDFGQLVSERTRIWKPGRQGGEVEILGPAEVCARWGVARVDQVVDMLGLMGDATDNIPGVPGVGEKTAAKLLAQFGSLEAVLAHAAEVKGRLGESLRQHADLARLSRRLATILTDVPLDPTPEDLVAHPRDDEALQALCAEFEFNAIGRRLFGDAFHAGRQGRAIPAGPAGAAAVPVPSPEADLFATDRPSAPATAAPSAPEADTASRACPVVATAREVEALVRRLQGREWVAVEADFTGPNPREARLRGLAFSEFRGRGCYVPVADAGAALQSLAPVLQAARPGKVGHDLKNALLALRRHGIGLAGPLFDTLIAHALIEPEQRHTLEYCAEAVLGLRLATSPASPAASGDAVLDLPEEGLEARATRAVARATAAWELRERFQPLMATRGLERVFVEVEMPVLPAIAGMEFEGVRVDAAVLGRLSERLAREMAVHEAAIHRLAGREFNVNSNKQLGEVLFDVLRLSEKPKRTATGQYATDEQTLLGLAGDHEIVRRILEHREVAKLKSTYADALPAAISPRTGRVHTTFLQAATATGRLSSLNPNLQNIPIRTGLGQEIRRAFVAREGGPEGPWKLLSADYSQIELRVLASMSGEEAMIRAFAAGEDIHASTAARVFGVMPGLVSPEQRRQAKMVNFGIAYGISAFGLAQRLGIPRKRAAEIIDHYFASYPGVRRYIDQVLESARQSGEVRTLTGRCRPLPDIRSGNATVRGAAERNAINTPIQGTAADLIKLAMARVDAEFARRELRSRLILQVHDELLFDVHPAEEAVVREVVVAAMRDALPLKVPVEVGVGVGADWIEAH